MRWTVVIAFILSERGRDFFFTSGRRSPWPSHPTSPESFGFLDFDHYSTRNQHQTNERVNANTSRRFKKATTARGGNVARGGRQRHCRLIEKLLNRDSKHLNPKEEHGEEEKKMVNSPTRRKRAQINPRAPPMINRYLLGFRPPMLEFTWLSLGFRWKTGRGEPRLPFYSFTSSISVRKSKLRDSIRLEGARLRLGYDRRKGTRLPGGPHPSATGR
jgi:hypothetical protein